MEQTTRVCSELGYTVCTGVLETGHRGYYHNGSEPDIADVFYASVSNYAPYNYEVPAGSGCFCGIAVSLLAIIAKHFHYRLQLQADLVDGYRISVENTTYTGPPAEVLAGRAIISVAPLLVSPERLRHFDLVHSFLVRDYQLAVQPHFLVTTGGVSESILLGFANSFTYDSWIAIFVTALVVVSMVWAMQRASYTVATGKPLCVGFRPRVLPRTLMMSWNMFANFFRQEAVRHPENLHSGYVVISFWSIFCLVISLAMVTRLNANLTSSIQSPPFTTVEEFLESDFKPVINRATDFLMDSAELKLAKNRTILYTAANSARDLMQSAVSLSTTEKVAIFCAMDEIPDCQNYGYIRATRIGVFNFVSTFQLKKHSPLFGSLSMMMLRVFQHGIIQREASVHKTITYNVQKVRERKSRRIPQAVPVGIPSIRSVLYLLVAGYILSFTSFMVELSRRR